MLKQIKSILTLALCLTAVSAQAIVSMEAIHLDNPHDGFSAKANFSLSGASGNTDKMLSEIGSHMQWHQQNITSYLLFNYRYGESRGQSDTSKAFIHARHIRPRSPFWDWELFAQVEHDKFARLSLRSLLGTGIRMKLIENPNRAHIFLGAGAFYAEEILEEDNLLNLPVEEQFVRANLYAIFQYKINSQLTFLSSTYYQPNIEHEKDFRLLEEAALKAKVAEQLTLKLSLEYAFDNQPPLNVEKRDLIYQTGLEYLF